MVVNSHLENVKHAVNNIDVAEVDRVVSGLRSLPSTATVYVLGNGGSASNASHLTLHLNDVSIRAVDVMAQVPIVTALSNDYSYKEMPTLFLMRQMRDLDCLFVITGSGNSENVNYALWWAKKDAGEYDRLGLLGFDGGKSKELVQRSVLVESRDYGVIEDCHSILIHAIQKELTS